MMTEYRKHRGVKLVVTMWTRSEKIAYVVYVAVVSAIVFFGSV